jgi:hypothetical protein
MVFLPQHSLTFSCHPVFSSLPHESTLDFVTNEQKFKNSWSSPASSFLLKVLSGKEPLDK